MPISFRRPVFAGTYLLVSALLLCLLGLTAPPAIGQEATPPTAFQKQLDRIDFAVVASGELSTTVSASSSATPVPPTPNSPSGQAPPSANSAPSAIPPIPTSASNSTSATCATPRTTPSSRPPAKAC